MSGDTPFFLSDPRPVDFMDPDDPRPVDFMDPDDPRPVDFMDPDDPRPVDFMDPDDPRPVDFMDPDDPRPVDFMDPDDPRPVDFMDPDDPRPVDFMDPDDPAVQQALRLLRRRQVRRRRGGRGRRPAPRRPVRRFPLQYSGRIVVRLSAEVDLHKVERAKDLRTVAKRLKLSGLRRVLKEYRVASHYTGRLVDVGFKEVELEYARVPPDERQLGDPGERVKMGEGSYREQSAVASKELNGKVPPAQPAAPAPAVSECEPTPTRPPIPQTRDSTWELERQAAASELPPLHSLAAYWRIDANNLPRKREPQADERRLNGWTPSHQHTVRAMLRELNQLPEVDLAYRELAVSDPGPENEDTYSLVQEYLDRAPIGIGARWVWQQKVPIGERMRFVDLEQGWIGQQDLEGIDPDLRIVYGANRDGVGEYRGHHGTAVLGQVIAAAGNRLGIRGIATRVVPDNEADPAAGDQGNDAAESLQPRVVLLASHYDKKRKRSGDVANAIRQAIAWMAPGDVLLLEVQRSYLPTEVDPLDRDAIRLAVSRGIIVIEAAGNGNADLDRYVDEEGRQVLARRHPDFRESGALMVAAARAAPPHNRLSGRVGVGSNHGTRIDCFAQGDRVVTTGYGDLNSYLEAGEADPEAAYTSSFGGTSGSSPIIAGAALIVQDLHKAQTGGLLSPWEVRRLLSDPATGTRQGGGVRGRIGIMPDLKRILRRRLGLVSDLYLRDSLEDDGAVPVRARTACSPDIVVSESGEARKPFDDSYLGAKELQAEKQYAIFVRVRNRGLQPVDEVKLRLYCSPVATLVTPGMWQRVEAASNVALSPEAGSAGSPQVKSQPVWTQAIPWTSGPVDPTLMRDDSDDSVRYCFTAIVRDGRDEEVVEPPSEWPHFDWRRYLAFLRSHNNLACSNMQVVEAGNASGLPFLVTGTPDRARVFDLEILRNLPTKTDLRLSTHPALASALRRYRLWTAVPESTEPPRVQLTLPRQPRLLVSGVRLLAGARWPCRFDLDGEAGHGHSLAIRQLYRGVEVGRVTWRFRG